MSFYWCSSARLYHMQKLIITWLRLRFLSSRKWEKAWGSNPRTCITSCIKVAWSKVSASAVKWRGATLTCPENGKCQIRSSVHIKFMQWHVFAHKTLTSNSTTPLITLTCYSPRKSVACCWPCSHQKNQIRICNTLWSIHGKQYDNFFPNTTIMNQIEMKRSQQNIRNAKQLIIRIKLPSTYFLGSCTPPSCPQAEYPLNRRFPLTGSTANALLNQSAVCSSACIGYSKNIKILSFIKDKRLLVNSVTVYSETLWNTYYTKQGLATNYWH